MSDHTIRYDYEPGYCGELVRADGVVLATFNDEPDKDDARRLVGCWNACVGLTIEQIEERAAGAQAPQPADPKSLTPPGAHPALMAASDYGLACNLMARTNHGTPEYDAAYQQCNEAWERIAAALGVSALGHQTKAPSPTDGENSA